MSVTDHLFGHNHHHCDNPWEGATPREIETREMLRHIIRNQEAIMAKIDDLTSDFNTYANAVNAFITEAQAAIATAQGASNDPAIDALDTKVRAAAATLATAAGNLATPVAAPPAAAPPA